MGDGLGVPGRPEDPVDPPGRHGGEERLQVEPQHPLPAGVEPGAGHGRTAPGEAVGGGMGGDPVEDPVEHHPLQVLQFPLRCFEEPPGAVGLADP